MLSHAPDAPVNIIYMQEDQQLTLSTLMLAFALVSMNFIPNSKASYRKIRGIYIKVILPNVLTSRYQASAERRTCRAAAGPQDRSCEKLCIISPSSKLLTFSPLSLDTCRLSLMSHLLPRTIFSTSDDACWVKSDDMLI